MTNSMLPYSFIPGTKAKASEVNANFNAISNYVDNSIASLLVDVNALIASKADTTELNSEHTVNMAGTDLNDYKIKGTYIFTSDYLPDNLPQNLEQTVDHPELVTWVKPANYGVSEGTLIVVGQLSSVIRQIWMCSGENPELFTREFINNTWSDWQSLTGATKISYNSYLKLPNGLYLQWGILADKNVVYPIAFRGFACPVVTKHGSSSAATKVDCGFTAESLTGFTYTFRSSTFDYMNWIAIGF